MKYSLLGKFKPRMAIKSLSVIISKWLIVSFCNEGVLNYLRHFVASTESKGSEKLQQPSLTFGNTVYPKQSSVFLATCHRLEYHRDLADIIGMLRDFLVELIMALNRELTLAGNGWAFIAVQLHSTGVLAWRSTNSCQRADGSLFLADSSC